MILYLCYSFMCAGYDEHFPNTNDIYRYYCGKYIGGFYDYFSIAFIYMSYIVMLGGAVVVSFLTFDLECIAIVVIAAVLMVAYEVALKQRGFVGNVTIAVLTGMMFLLGGAVVGDAADNVIVALMALLVSVGREIAKDIEDMESDEGDRLTLPMRIGPRKAAALACVFFVAGPVLSVAPMVWHTYGPLYYSVVVADAIFVYCAAVVFSSPHRAQKFAKLAMVVALVAFIAGVFRF